MFIADALANFSSQILKKINEPIQQADQKQQEDALIVQNSQPNKSDKNPQQNNQQKQIEGKRQRSPSHDQQLKEFQKQSKKIQKEEKQENPQVQNKNQQQQIQYATFEKNDKIVVKQTFQNGWWYGHPVKKPQHQGFFPSNYVRVGAPPPPSQKKQKKSIEKQQQQAFNPNQHGQQWLRQQLSKVQTNQPVKSDYYQGIKGYKMIKVNENNQNILKGNYVQYDVNTGLARVPVKDQSPTSKAVRQMGYYFDFHQWNEQRNKNPNQKARPDPRKKKAKKLNLKMMDF